MMMVGSNTFAYILLFRKPPRPKHFLPSAYFCGYENCNYLTHFSILRTFNGKRHTSNLNTPLISLDLNLVSDKNII
jgi:hypothetical protein